MRVTRNQVKKDAKKMPIGVEHKPTRSSLERVADFLNLDLKTASPGDGRRSDAPLLPTPPVCGQDGHERGRVDRP